MSSRFTNDEAKTIALDLPNKKSKALRNNQFW